MTSPSSPQVRNPSLIERLDAFQELLEEAASLDSPTPEQEAAYGTALAAMEEAAIEKVDAVCGWIERQEDEAGVLAMRSEALAARSKAKLDAVKRLKTHFVFAFTERGIKKAGGALEDNYTMRVQKNGGDEALIIDNPWKLADEWMMIETTVRVPLALLQEATNLFAAQVKAGHMISWTNPAGPFPNKQMIRSALQIGHDVEGCRLERGSHLRIS